MAELELASSGELDILRPFHGWAPWHRQAQQGKAEAPGSLVKGQNHLNIWFRLVPIDEHHL
jgi:hypothetical protein